MDVSSEKIRFALKANRFFHAKAQSKTQRRKEEFRFFFAPLRLPLRLCAKLFYIPIPLR